jgi:hypothetical protein
MSNFAVAYKGLQIYYLWSTDYVCFTPSVQLRILRKRSVQSRVSTGAFRAPEYHVGHRRATRHIGPCRGAQNSRLIIYRPVSMC